MSAAKNKSLRLEYLDGLRACAAFYVVLFHTVLGFSCAELAGMERALCRGFAFGHEAVAVFIVLSGYVLMLPVARSADGRMRRSLSAYVARRAFRILPPYYAALLLSMLMIVGVPMLQVPATGTIWDDSLPGLAAGPVVSHLLLVHNWFPEWAYQINGPLWSVATEWQIYFFFPLLLLPLWQRHGLLACIAVAFALGYLPLLWMPETANVAIPWYLGLFALGMACATVGFSERPLETRLRSWNWGVISTVIVLGCAVGGLVFAKLWFRSKALADLSVGCATASVLLYLTQRKQEGGAPNTLLRLLEWRPLVALGEFSYSLYLTHLPVVSLCYFALAPLGLPPLPLALILLIVAPLASLIVARVFFVTVERYFLRPPAALRRYFEPPAAVASRHQPARQPGQPAVADAESGERAP